VGVVQQVDQDPPDRVGVAHRRELLGDLDLHRSIGDAEVACDRPNEIGEIDADRFGRRLALLEPRGDQQLLDERCEVSRVAFDDLEQLGRLDQRLGLLAGLRGRQHHRQRRSELVGHEPEELGLHPVELDELDDVGALGVEEPRVGDRHRALLREQAQCAKVVLAERSRRPPRSR
jgi:hypothetical protein